MTIVRQVLLIGSFTGILVMVGFAKADDSIESLWERMSKPGKLAVEAQLLDRYSLPLNPPTVDDVVYLQISVRPKPRGLYAVVDALDGQPNFVYEKVQLPYRLGRNFKGQLPGSYTITIGVIDSKGRTGKADVPIQVAHGE